MNRAQLESIKDENFRRVDLFSYRPKVNAVEISLSNSFEHEFAKFLAVWLIRHGLPSNQLPQFFETVANFIPMNEEVHYFVRAFCQNFERDWQRPKVLTECRFENQGRWDIFVLDTGERVEIVDRNEQAKKPYDGKTVVIRL